MSLLFLSLSFVFLGELHEFALPRRKYIFRHGWEGEPMFSPTMDVRGIARGGPMIYAPTPLAWGVFGDVFRLCFSFFFFSNRRMHPTPHSLADCINLPSPIENIFFVVGGRGNWRDSPIHGA